MDTTVKLRLLNLLKVLTVISFLFINIDNGKFVVPMWLVVLGSLAFLAAPSWEGLSALLLPLSLLTVFVPAIGKINDNRAQLLGMAAVALLWLLLLWIFPSCLSTSSVWARTVLVIFACLSVSTLIVTISVLFEKSRTE